MTRSVWKGPHINASLLHKATTMKNTRGSRYKINTWSRSTVILPQFTGLHFNVYNGNKWISVLVTEDMIGHKFGEFALTRKAVKHKKKK